jgi:hypothetical protein
VEEEVWIIMIKMRRFFFSSFFTFFFGRPPHAIGHRDTARPCPIAFRT